MTYQIRDVDSQCVPRVHHLNEQALPHVNSVPPGYFLKQVENDSYFRAVWQGTTVAAFLLAMDERADYDSPNFLWFRDRYPQFVYIDRVVVCSDHRRCGLGASLYGDVTRWTRQRAPVLACEVNLQPSNDASLRFHERQGFAAVGVQDTEGGYKTVSLMIKELDAEGPRP
jgi:predicted GNAT superfamily acetyltransferase